jgi:phenylacetate-coenzyme A ligase PaaK-like adenylate-forming protein
MRKHFANTGLNVDGSRTAVLPAELEAEVRAIYERSPLYARRRAIHPEPLRWACFDEIPLLTKQEIVAEGHCAFFDDCAEVDRRISVNEVERETTSGTTTAPMTVIMEQGWWDEQTRRAYRAHPVLAEFADRPHRKAVLAPVNCSSNLCPYEDFPFPNRYFNGTVYLNLSSDPFCFNEVEWDRIVTEIQATKPEILEGEPVYLSLLARAVRRREVKVPSLRAIILTYGKASLVHSRRIAAAFPVPQVDLYGSTEAGYIFVGDAFQDNLRVIDENAFVELVPWRGMPEVFQTQVTTRRRRAMPLLRYHTGDVVRRCAGGFRILGRERDLYLRPDGGVVAAGEIDAALPADFACWHYCLVQTAESRWDFHYVAEHNAPDAVAGAIAGVLGDGVRVNLFRRRYLQPGSSGKFSLLKPLAK